MYILLQVGYVVAAIQHYVDDLCAYLLPNNQHLIRLALNCRHIASLMTWYGALRAQYGQQ